MARNNRYMAMRGESGLQGDDWVNEEEPETLGTNVEVVDGDVDSQVSTVATKPTGNVWGEMPSASKSEKAKPEKPKSEAYRPGARIATKKVDNFFPALGTAPVEPQKETQAKDPSNRFAELQEKEVVVAVKPPAEAQVSGKSGKKKKDKWKTVELDMKVATTVAEQDLVLKAEADKMYEPKVTKSYSQRQERRSDFPVGGEADTTWRKVGEPAVVDSRPAGTFSVRREEVIKRADEGIVRRDEPFRRVEDAPPRRDDGFRRGEEVAPRSDPLKSESSVWRAQAAAQPTPVETERKDGPLRKFVNTKKKTEVAEAAEEPREDEWKKADKQAQVRPKVNMWAQGDPQICG